MISPTNFSSWWGRHTIEAGRNDFWQIGPLGLWVEHLPHQWRIAWTHSEDWLDPRVRLVPNTSQSSVPLDAERITCALGSAGRDEIVFVPALANRPLINRLETPLHVLPGDSIQLYVVSPLWLRLEMVQPTKLLHEIPVYRLSDTWFGPMSLGGELAYASAASAYLDLRDVPLRLHCVITSVNIRNLGADSLKLDRLSVPMPRLSLFYSTRTGFWTDSVSLERRDDRELATLRLERQPPLEASPAQFIAGPRMASTEGTSVTRAFSQIFRERSNA